MDVVLIILGVLGLGAILIAAFVFTAAARNYVSDDDMPAQGRMPIQRRTTDRRSGQMVQFPLTINGETIPEDRRRLPDRRRAA